MTLRDALWALFYALMMAVSLVGLSVLLSTSPGCTPAADHDPRASWTEVFPAPGMPTGTRCWREGTGTASRYDDSVVCLPPEPVIPE